MGGIGVIVNPHASGNKRRPRRVSRFQAIVGDDGEVFETTDLQHLDEVLIGLREREIKILAVCGGDGSFFLSLIHI